LSAEIRKAVEVLSEPGGVVELRAIKNGTTAAGYFADSDTLIREAVKLDEQAFAVYVTANPVDPALLSRAANRIKRPLRETTSDRDVLRRRWLLVDFVLCARPACPLRMRRRSRRSGVRARCTTT
jgi:hypothetical protein